MDRIVTQGLGDDHLVTQGWSTTTLSSSLISQGMGGPQILLQGLVGSGAAVLISPSGTGWCEPRVSQVPAGGFSLASATVRPSGG